MPMTDEALGELKGLIGVARKRPLNFGLCMGKSPESTVLVMHRMKDPSVLARQAKKDGDTAKICYGTVSVKGKRMTLTCIDDIPAGIAKRTKGFLSGQGLPMKVVCLDSSGNLADDDGEEEPEAGPEDEVSGEDDDAGMLAGDSGETAGGETEGEDGGEVPVAPPPPPEPEADPQAAAWAKVAAAFQPLVDVFVASPNEKAPLVKTAWEAALAAAEKGKFADAMAVATKVKPLLTIPVPPPPPPVAPGAVSPDEAKWNAASGAMESLFSRAMGLNPANRTQLQAAWMMAQEKAEGGDFAGGLAVLARLKPALDAVLAAGAGASDQASIPQDVVPFQKSRVLWADTRSKMRDEMRKLENEIMAICAKNEDLAPLAGEARNLSKRLDVFDDTLEQTLDAITTSPDGPERGALKKKALDQIKAYAGALNDDFFKEVDGGNGFTPVAVAASARQSLAAIAKTLA